MADLDVPITFDYTPLVTDCVQQLLDCSITSCNPKMLKCALSLGGNPNELDKPDKTTLMRCIDLDNSDIIKILVKNTKVDVNTGTTLADSPLHYAVKNNKLNAAEGLLQAAGKSLEIDKIGSDGRTALIVALEERNLAMVKILANHGSDSMVTHKGDTGLHMLLKIM